MAQTNREGIGAVIAALAVLVGVSITALITTTTWRGWGCSPFPWDALMVFGAVGLVIIGFVIPVGVWMAAWGRQHLAQWFHLLTVVGISSASGSMLFFVATPYLVAAHTLLRQWQCFS